MTLVVFGIEVAAVRLWAGLNASLTGKESFVSGPLYLAGGVMLWARRIQGEIRIPGSILPKMRHSNKAGTAPQEAPDTGSNPEKNLR